MDYRMLSICAGAIALAAGGIYYGVKFCKSHNYLIGIEWFLLAISSLNFMVYEFNHSQINYIGVLFLDTFSRAFGLPIITIAGLMTLTQSYRPSILADIIIFVIFSAATFFLLTDYMATALPYFLLVMWTIFTLYLLYFAFMLFMFGEKNHSVAMILVAFSNQTVASMYDFYKIPGDETNIIFNFYTIALFVWAFLTVQIWYSYCALERAMKAKTVKCS